MWWFDVQMAWLAFQAWWVHRALSDDGFLPGLEHNQGALSLMALAAALVFFAIETKRANRADQDARDSETRRLAHAEELERQNRAAAEALERENRQAAMTLEAARHERAAEEKARQDEAIRHAENDRQMRHMSQFVLTAAGIVAKVEEQIKAEQKMLAGTTNRLMSPAPETKVTARVAADSLIAIIPAAPLNAALIADVRQVAYLLELLAGKISGAERSQNPILAEVLEQLEAGRALILAHSIALFRDLFPRSEPPPSTPVVGETGD